MEKSSDEPEPAEHSLDTGGSCSFINFQSCNIHLTKLYHHHLKKKFLCCNLYRVIEFVSFKFDFYQKKITNNSNDSNDAAVSF